MRQLAMNWLVELAWHKWTSEKVRARLLSWHGKLLAAEMAARRKRGQVEVKTGVFWMSQEELDEHAKRF